MHSESTHWSTCGCCRIDCGAAAVVLLLCTAVGAHPVNADASGYPRTTTAVIQHVWSCLGLVVSQKLRRPPSERERAGPTLSLNDICGCNVADQNGTGLWGAPCRKQAGVRRERMRRSLNCFGGHWPPGHMHTPTKNTNTNSSHPQLRWAAARSTHARSADTFSSGALPPHRGV